MNTNFSFKISNWVFYFIIFIKWHLTYTKTAQFLEKKFKMIASDNTHIY